MKLKSYLIQQLGATFFPIFFVLFFITSIIFLVRIASMTSVITINFYELILLYVYVLPNILFYTLPISFFISLVITLSKLSTEYELIVLTSFGLNPLNILKVFLPVTILVSISLLIISLVLIPKGTYLTKDTISKKTKEANFNVKASEFGQKFGDWLIYIEEKNDNNYKKVKLFRTEKNSDKFIIAKEAELINKDGNLNFELRDGKSFVLEDNITNQINYEIMIINDTIVESMAYYTNAIEHWKKLYKTSKFSFYILTSIFPLISLFLVVCFGYFNPRYDKNNSVSYSILFIVIYYVITDILTKQISVYSLPTIVLFWLSLTYYMYIKGIKKAY